MDIEKLIEQLNRYFEGKELKRGAALDAATALSALQAENEKLRAELKSKVDLVFQQAKELDRRHLLLQEQEAELDQVKRERDVAPVRHGRWKLVGADKRGRGGNWKCTGRDGCGKSYPYICDYCPNCGALMKEAEHEAN